MPATRHYVRRYVAAHEGGGGVDPALAGRVTAAEADIDALQAADVAFAAADSSLDARLDTAEADIDALQAADTALDGRLDALEADPGYTAPTRTTAQATTSSLASAASENLSITLAKGYRLLAIQVSRPARVRLYTTSAARTADASRTAAVDPASDAGVALDFVAVGTSTYSLSPLVDGANLEASPSAAISMRVTNNDASTGTVAVTLTYIATEV